MKFVNLNEEHDILTVSLNRPDVHNAFNPEMIQELTQIFSETAKLLKYKVIILRGEGKSFCAGADLMWMKSMVKYNFEENVVDAQKLFLMFESMKNCPVPLIGKIQGNVFGGGLGLVAVCDIVAAESNTNFCFSEAKLGLVPSVISPFVKRKMLPHILREVFLTAEVFDSKKSLESGLIHFRGTTEEVNAFVAQKILDIKKCGKQALSVTKKLLNDLENMSFRETKEETTAVISKRRVSEEGQEGLSAFLEKRKPNWIT